MEKTFETKEEAEKYIKSKIWPVEWFCPLINSTCNPMCTCYEDVRVVKSPYRYGEISGARYIVYKNQCGNTMFDGLRWEQNT